MKLTPISIHGDPISVDQLKTAIEFMKGGAFKAAGVCAVLEQSGVMDHETAYRGADRLIQKCRKAKQIEWFDARWKWIGEP